MNIEALTLIPNSIYALLAISVVLLVAVLAILSAVWELQASAIPAKTSLLAPSAYLVYYLVRKKEKLGIYYGVALTTDPDKFAVHWLNQQEEIRLVLSVVPVTAELASQIPDSLPAMI